MSKEAQMRDDDAAVQAPSRLDRMLAGRTNADREAAADAGRRLLIFMACVAFALFVLLTELLKMLGLRFGLWALPAFAPGMLWKLHSMLASKRRHPAWMSGLRGRRRLAAIAVTLAALRLFWPLWADPAAAAWREHTELAPMMLVPELPFGAVVAAAPVALGFVAFLLLVFVMLIPPLRRSRRRARPAPPAGPPTLRSSLLNGGGERSER